MEDSETTECWLRDLLAQKTEKTTKTACLNLRCCYMTGWSMNENQIPVCRQAELGDCGGCLDCEQGYTYQCPML